MKGGAALRQEPAPVWLSHPSGNQFFRHLARSLAGAGRLGRLCTSLDWPSKSVLGRLLPGALRSELGRRSFSEELHVRVESHPWREAGRLLFGRLGPRWLVRHEEGAFSVDAVYRDFDRWVAGRVARAPGNGVVYAYEDAAEASFGAAKCKGWPCVYDLPIACWPTSRRLLEEEALRLPQWAHTLGGTADSREKLERKDRELAMADLVVCPSRFVADSLPPEFADGKRVLVAPFGSPPPGPEPAARPAGSPLRVLFAGSMGQRKGLADLFDAVARLGRSDVELVVMGSPCAPMEFYRRAGGRFVHEPPRPHGAVLALMRSCDVFCLPSIVEGRALVVQEAMSQGLPVIVTANTGADDVVEEGINGFVVPIREPVQIAARLAWFADNRRAIPEMGREAQRAAARHTWEAYGQAILAGLAQLHVA